MAEVGTAQIAPSKIRLAETRSKPWKPGLSQLEQFIVSQNSSVVPQEAQGLINDIIRGSGSLIALVFDAKGREVVALPQAELYTGPDRMELGVDRFDLPADLTQIRNAVRLNMVRCSQEPTPWKQRGVVLIERNLGEDAKDHPITVANLNKKAFKQQDHPFLNRIAHIQAGLNSTSSGKSVKNAV